MSITNFLSVRPIGSMTRSILVVVLLSAISGCSMNDNSDLHQRIAQIKAKPAGKIPPLPVFKPYQTYSYSASPQQDPFLPMGEELLTEGPESDVRGPESPFAPGEHNPEALEEYPLDTLRYVGQLVMSGKDWAIVTSPDMVVHRVQVGNYLGQNYGKIIRIDEGQIIIVEKVYDDFRNRWIDRDAALSLTE